MSASEYEDREERRHKRDQETALVALKKMELENARREMDMAEKGDPTTLKRLEYDMQLAKARTREWTIRFVAFCAAATVMGTSFIFAVLMG